ncbi:N-6 DNA methylase [Vibrio cholerae]|uniref:Eco57I restriction-modification methylase domain-containing protein n=1 Tax=Vibrio cholerae TaxID=666 RepID=UPI0011D996A4|nr:N-6 DNA methylase [Vibrio cholerae]TXX94321.1 N-6 DNA methylase [Vibrio cholerae]
MRQALDKTLRKKLEDTVVKARDIVEQAVFEALQRLGVAEAQAPSYLNEEERALRNKLRAHARQLGDKLKDGKQETERLINEMAYEHWHRMLFARYLEQNNLLMYDEYTPVTLDECFELAEEEPNCKDGWELAGRLAQKMLPQIFRVDSPVFDIKLSMNRVEELESLIAQLDPKTYQAQDSLGWCYQFWQTKKKDQVNKSGVKIGAQELSPVTQLFTEPYMVSFLLDNALGAWWANKRLSQDDLIRANNEQELRELAAIPGVPLEYLRFSKEEEATQWKPAAGGFEKWPEHLSELKTLDPCCGSGHFLVAVFLMLVPMRMQLEGLSEKQAVDAVLRDNIHGLELDQRCVELAAFALALEAWRYPNAGGYRVLPELQLACSGMSITEAQKEWKDLAKGDEALTDAIAWMQETFKDAPILGSLIDPTKALEEGQVPPWELLQRALEASDKATSESKITTQGLGKSAAFLARKYDWVVTNVPYRSANDLCEQVRNYAEKACDDAKTDLATIFFDKLTKLISPNGGISLVTPQNVLIQPTYKHFRKRMLCEMNWRVIARLGPGAFQEISGEVVNVLLLTLESENGLDDIVTVDCGRKSKFDRKVEILKSGNLSTVSKAAQKDNADNVIYLTPLKQGKSVLGKYCSSVQGIKTGGDEQFKRCFWESPRKGDDWIWYQSTVSNSVFFGGLHYLLNWGENGSHLARKQGLTAWRKKGVAVSQMSDLPYAMYMGGAFDSNMTAIVTENEESFLSLINYTFSDEFSQDVRDFDQSMKPTNSSFEKVIFDKNRWLSEGGIKLKSNVPLPFSNDTTQWIFHGHPCASVIWDEESKTTAIANLRQDDTVLQVAVARLLGYQWPAELDSEMELAQEMRVVMKKNAGFAGLIDDDGIVCIPAVRGEKTAAKRLEAILHKAYGNEWTSSVEQNLLKAVKAKDLESWLRDKFFDQHSKLFQHRPFIWQVWDGLKDGFSALVNYHKLDYKGLERLIYTYLDDWISIQKRDIADGKDGADIRLNHAEILKTQLEAILAGEKGLDIFVRWKPLAEQPIGWNPDLNDGVRLNIRPFMLAKDVGKKGAGVLRGKPNIHWKKDRGTDVASAPWFDLGPVYGEKEGSRINEHHLTLAEKKAAREQVND